MPWKNVVKTVKEKMKGKGEEKRENDWKRKKK